VYNYSDPTNRRPALPTDGAKHEIGDADFDAAVRMGRSLELVEAVAYASGSESRA
jgi:hypothetical protein